MNKSEIEIAKSLPRYLPKNPLLRGLPQHLKEPENYEKIMKAIMDAGATRCSHAEMHEMANCLKCARAALNRSEMMRKLGFSNGKQYLEWRKVHEQIRKKREKLQ